MTGTQLTSLRSNVEVRGLPAHLVQQQPNKNISQELWAEQIKYNKTDAKISTKTNVRFQQKSSNKGVLTILGDQLTLVQKQESYIEAYGSPLTISIEKGQQKKVLAQAKKLVFNQKSGRLVLSGQVSLINNIGKMTAEVIIYNIHTGLTRIPKNKNKPLQIIQKKKAL